MPHGRCTLPADEMGRVLERIAGLTRVIRPEAIRQALAATGRVNSRSWRLTCGIILRAVLAIGVFTDVPIRQLFKLCRRLRTHERSPRRSSLRVARKRLGPAPVRHVFEQP